MENNQVKDKENIFIRNDYIHYMIQYEGEFNKGLNNFGIYLTSIDENYAIVSIKTDLIKETIDTITIADIINKYLENSNFRIVYLQPREVYSLEQVSAIDATQVNLLQADLPLDLTGKGVVIGIIDTGIDYLSEAFRDNQGKCRINEIWDQSTNFNNGSGIVSFGTIYKKEEITKAIDMYKSGGNPYDIVPTKDENGHGTNMAGIVGAFGKNTKIKGVAPDCEFVIVKLAEASNFKYEYNYGKDVIAYNSSVIVAAIKYLKEYLLREKKPVVILIPLGTTSGNHKGEHILDDYIEAVASNVGIVVVTGAGNEAIEDGHVSGIIQNTQSNEVIELLVEKGQKDFYLEIWVDLPSIVDVSLISPSGQSTGIIPAILNISGKYSFILEKTNVKIYNYLPEKYTGDQLIRIYFFDVSPGIWRIKLGLKEGEMAKYNVWLMQKEFITSGTRFTPSDPYGTVTVPGDSDFVITVGAYNQNNNNLLSYSGVSFREEYIDKVDFVAGGVNTMTVGINNSVDIINGTSLAAGIGAGACILLMEWGIVDGNYPYMYTQSIKTFLTRGTIARRGDTYPNPRLGYGIINFYKIFENMV